MHLSSFIVAAMLITGTGRLFSATTGAELYKTKCSVCHGPDGAGNTPLGKRTNARDLRSAEVQQQSDEVLTSIITNGQKVMPAFGKNLGPQKIRDVVAYLRSIAIK